jgi:hypothetical protein
MLNTNPMFVNPQSNYHLLAGSPCVNSGTNLGLPFVGAAPDMGAYEFGATGFADAGHSAGLVLYPNPSSGTFFVRSEGQAGMIRVFDSAGRIQCELLIGSSVFTKVDGTFLASGLYFVEVSDEKGRHTGKLMIQ